MPCCGMFYSNLRSVNFGVIIMKKVISAVILALMIVFCASGCSGASENNYVSNDTVQSSQDRQQSDQSQDGENSSNEGGENSTGEIHPLSSSEKLPIDQGNWGTASKYNTKEKSYVNIPIKITSVVHGEKAAETVKDFMDKSSSYNYTEPDKNAEWVVAEYQISLDGFPVDKGGADASVTSFIMGSGGGFIDNNGEKWSTTTINITDNNYYYEGIVTGKIAYQMLAGHTDYIIVVGEYNETQAFFTENKT